jgi:hypothetical protein
VVNTLIEAIGRKRGIRHLRPARPELLNLGGSGCGGIEHARFRPEAVRTDGPGRRQDVRVVIAAVALPARRMDRDIGGDPVALDQVRGETGHQRLAPGRI